MKLDKEELDFIKDSTAKLNNAKMVLGDLEIRKHDILADLFRLKAQFQLREKQLIEKYGLNSTINMETGEVTEKQTT